MKGKKLLDFLHMLSPKERRHFKQFLISPYFNKSQELVKLNSTLVSKLGQTNPDLSDEAISAALFGKGKYDKVKLKRLRMALLKLLLEFLKIQHFQSDPVEGQKHLLRKLLEVGDTTYFLQYYSEANRSLVDADLSEEDLFGEQVQLIEELDRHLDLQPERKHSKHLEEASEHSTNSYRIRLLKYGLRSLNQQSIYGNEININGLDALLEYLETHSDEQIPLIQILYKLVLVYQSPKDRELYERLRTYLTHSFSQLSSQAGQHIYAGLINFSARQMNQGKGEYILDLYELYREGLEREFLLMDGKIPVWHYKNVVSVGCRVGDLDPMAIGWVEQFLQTFQDRVVNDYKRNAFHFNMGVLYHAKADYEQAGVYFNRVLQDYSDLFYGLDARGYMLQVYYEQNNMTGVESLCHSFRMYLDRNQEIPAKRKERYQKHIRFFRRFINIPPKNTQRAKELKKEILQTWDKGTGKDWFLEKLDAIILSDGPGAMGEE